MLKCYNVSKINQQNRISKLQILFLVLFIFAFFVLTPKEIIFAQSCVSDLDCVCCYNLLAYPRQKICQDFTADIGCQSPYWGRVDSNVGGRCRTLAKMNNQNYQLYCVEPPTISQPKEKTEEKETAVVVPELQIQMPGFKGFTKEIEICLEGGKTLEECQRGQRGYSIPWIGEYIVAIYKWSVGAIAIIAVVMIMIGGFQWLMAGGNVGIISDAKSRITYAVIGLILILGSNLVLSSINPNLTIFKPLIIGKIERIELADIEREEDIEPQGSPDIVPLSGENIIGSISVDKSMVEPLRRVALKLKQQGYQLIAASGYRSPEKQAELIRKHCTCDNSGCRGPCNPATCLMTKGPTSCPHTSGRAVDLWGGKNGKSCWTKGAKGCQNNLTECINNECQKALINAMKEEGFCRLCTEGWHFEKPKMSSCCE
ncbi:MAG: hypothetical protein ACP5IX_00780 [Patescibacteria group bacterium]